MHSETCSFQGLIDDVGMLEQPICRKSTHWPIGCLKLRQVGDGSGVFPQYGRPCCVVDHSFLGILCAVAAWVSEFHLCRVG